MKLFCTLVLSALLISCHSHKEVQKDVTAVTDSVGTSAIHRTFSLSDSLVNLFDFEFDSLSIIVERPVLPGEAQATRPTEIVRLRAVGGKLKNSRQEHKAAVEIKSQLDSTAYKVSSADKSAEHTASTAVYDPPNTTVIICSSVAAALLLLFLYLYIRRK